jgi:hypothetical protein
LPSLAQFQAANVPARFLSSMATHDLAISSQEDGVRIVRPSLYHLI